MVMLGGLWTVIAVATVAGWGVATALWMMPHHRGDYRRLPDQEAARRALTPQSIEPGLYDIPHIASWSALTDPEVVRLFEEGPVGFFTVQRPRVPSIGRGMALALGFYAVVNLAIAYVVGRSLSAEAGYWSVFRLTATVAWMAHGTAAVPEAIWFGRPWKAVLKQVVDAFVVGLAIAAVFAWLWP